MTTEQAPKASWYRWVKTSKDLFLHYQKAILSVVKTPHVVEEIPISFDGNDYHINTLSTTDVDPKKPHILLVHGFGGGIGTWNFNIDALAAEYNVHAIDILGFSGSARPRFKGMSLDDTEHMMVNSMEAWRKAKGLDKIVLAGHSYGGYLSTLYALHHPDKLHHLLLVDPYGFPEPPPPEKRPARPWYFRAAVALLSGMQPLALLRGAGPWGPGLVARIRGDLARRIGRSIDEDAFYGYIYHCNAASPSGEYAFSTMNSGIGYAARPMLNRIHTLPSTLPITFLYGDRSWMSFESGILAQNLLPESDIEVHIMRDSGHHVMWEATDQFNHHACHVAHKVELGGDASDSECDEDALPGMVEADVDALTTLGLTVDV
eukprot:m.43328 g.43328  ORF g.43328 m.43328 type:complete len:375 (+) comp10777_c0_seq1:439-1563(+)